MLTAEIKVNSKTIIHISIWNLSSKEKAKQIAVYGYKINNDKQNIISYGRIEHNPNKSALTLIHAAIKRHLS